MVQVGQVSLQLRQTHMPRRKPIVKMPLDLDQTRTTVEHHQDRVLFVLELKIFERNGIFKSPATATTKIQGLRQQIGTDPQGNGALGCGAGGGRNRCH